MKRFAAVLLTSLLVLTACSDGGDPEPEPQAQPEHLTGEISFQVSGEQEEVAAYEAVIAAFADEQPDVDVEMIPIADKGDHLARLATGFSGGNPPDVFLVNFREYSQFVVRDAIEPIASHLEDVNLDDYYPQPQEAFTFGGELQCFPQNVSSLVAYYNKDLFEKAGLEHPPADWTWDDFRDYAVALTDGKVHGLGIEPNVIRLAPFIWSNGGELVDDLDAPTRFTLEDPASREALEFIVGLVRDDKVVPTLEELEAQDLETRFVSGKLGMLLSSRRDTPAFREVLELNWDVAALPVAETPANILHSDAYCISRASENVDAAAAFVRFAVGRQGQTITALAGRTVPSLIEISTSGAFLDPTQPPEHSQVFLDSVPLLQRTPVLPTWPEIEEVVEEVLTLAFYEDGFTIDQTIEQINAVAEPLFQEAADIVAP